MYLIDTCVISEVRKGKNANTGVIEFFSAQGVDDSFFLSVVTIGELRKVIDNLIGRNDLKQAQVLTEWLD